MNTPLLADFATISKEKNMKKALYFLASCLCMTTFVHAETIIAPSPPGRDKRLQ